MEQDQSKTKSAAAVRSSDLLADSPTWPHVLAFAERMEAKLANNRHKGYRTGWLKDDALALYDRLEQESCELLSALKDPDATFEKIANEAADVANFSMMVADVVLTRKRSI